MPHREPRWWTWLTLLACGAWLGTLIFLGYGVAGPIFSFLDSRTQAGLLNGIILYKMNHIEWVCAVVLLASSLSIVWRIRDKSRILQCLLALAAVAILFAYSVTITREMERVKAVVQNFDLPIESDPQPERARFDELHRLYSGLVKANMVVVFGISCLVGFRKHEE